MFRLIATRQDAPHRVGKSLVLLASNVGVVYFVVDVTRRPAPKRLGDAELRALLKQRLRPHLLSRDTALLDELGLCRHEVRIDVALVNGELHGYEIKSDRDSVRRLARQAVVYGEVLDRATIVTGERLLDDAVSAVPDWWEVLTTSPRNGKLRVLRRGRRNPHVVARRLAELLWREDGIVLLAEHGVARGFANMPRDVIWDRVAETCTTAEIASAVRRRLKAMAALRSAPSPS